MTFDLQRFRQTAFREGDKLIFKRNESLPLLDTYAYSGDYLLRSTTNWTMHRSDGSERSGPYSDTCIKQTLGSREFSDLEGTIELTDTQAETLIKKFESEEKVW